MRSKKDISTDESYIAKCNANCQFHKMSVFAFVGMFRRSVGFAPIERAEVYKAGFMWLLYTQVATWQQNQPAFPAPGSNSQ